MTSRPLAIALAFAFTAWSAVPAMATIECHGRVVPSQHAACAHCAKANKDSQSALRATCCTVRAPAERLPVASDARSLPAPQLQLSVVQLPADGYAASAQLRVVADENATSPPPLQRNRPLLN
ncbi:MAG: hypothetical protein JST54_09610 [Deltaproteobacteria bacterium]|nr:hypothetical protein [Deltaproteobacteria bacterium]